MKTLIAIILMLFFNYRLFEDNGDKDTATELIPGNLTITLPNNLKRISNEEIILESPLVNQRPSAIYLDKIRKIKFAINYGSSPALDRDLPKIKNYFESVYKRAAKQFLSCNLKIINHQKIIVMRFTLPNRDIATTLIFNYLFFTSVNGKLFMADYSFPIEQSSAQEKQAVAIINSIKIKN